MGKPVCLTVERECCVCRARFSVKSNNPKRTCSRACSNKLKTGRPAVNLTEEARVCVVCHKTFMARVNNPRVTCSSHCRALTPRKRLTGYAHPMKRPEVVAKVAETTQRRYTKEALVKKTKQGMLRKYGVDSASKVKEFKDKAVRHTDYAKVQESCRKTNLERYGVENPMQNQSVSRKMANERWSKESNQIYKEIRMKEWWDEHYSGKHVSIASLCKQFGVGQSLMTAVHQALDVAVVNQKRRTCLSRGSRNSLK